jgi:hypothetical protein
MRLTLWLVFPTPTEQQADDDCRPTFVQIRPIITADASADTRIVVESERIVRSN